MPSSTPAVSGFSSLPPRCSKGDSFLVSFDQGADSDGDVCDQLVLLSGRGSRSASVARAAAAGAGSCSSSSGSDGFSLEDQSSPDNVGRDDLVGGVGEEGSLADISNSNLFSFRQINDDIYSSEFF